MRNYERAKLHDLENLRNKNEIRQFYKKLKEQIQGFKASNTSICYSKFGTLITIRADVTKRWVESFNDLLNGNIEISPNLTVFHSTASGEFNIDTHHLFIDFKKAYDSIRRDKLLTAMYALDIHSLPICAGLL